MGPVSEIQKLESGTRVQGTQYGTRAKNFEKGSTRSAQGERGGGWHDGSGPSTMHANVKGRDTHDT